VAANLPWDEVRWRSKPSEFFETVRGKAEYLIEQATDQWLDQTGRYAWISDIEAEAIINACSQLFDDYFQSGVYREA